MGLERTGQSQVLRTTANEGGSSGHGVFVATEARKGQNWKQGGNASRHGA